jgi:hypothetical protein
MHALDLLERLATACAPSPVPGIVLRLLGRVLRIASFVLAGVGVAFLLLRVISDNDDTPGWGSALLLLLLAALTFTVGVLLSLLAERLQRAREEHLLAHQPRLAPHELEAERLKEQPRLARESGSAIRELRREDGAPPQPLL